MLLLATTVQMNDKAQQTEDLDVEALQRRKEFCHVKLILKPI